MELLFTPDNSGTDRGTGYATVDYSSSAEDETVVETTEDELSTIFETIFLQGRWRGTFTKTRSTMTSSRSS